MPFQPKRRLRLQGVDGELRALRKDWDTHVDGFVKLDGDGVLDCVDQCSRVDDAVFAPECAGAIPTVSAWGLMVLTLLLLAGSKIYFGCRRAICNAD